MTQNAAEHFGAANLIVSFLNNHVGTDPAEVACYNAVQSLTGTGAAELKTLPRSDDMSIQRLDEQADNLVGAAGIMSIPALETLSIAVRKPGCSNDLARHLVHMAALTSTRAYELQAEARSAAVSAGS